jgi:GT2 family glycosyltransferase
MQTADLSPPKRISATNLDVSVVIVNYNAGSLLLECLKLCLPQVGHVVVVDNASSDSSIDLVEIHFRGSSKLQVISNEFNLGFAAACNQGAEVCLGDFVLFLNPDCMADAGSIGLLREALLSDLYAGMSGGLLLDSDGREQQGGRRYVPTPWRSLVRVLHLEALDQRWPKLFQNFNLYKQPLPKTTVTLEAISGACTMVKREAMRDVGPWDEGYFLHCEDLDLCMRYRQKAWSILFVPSAQFTHFQGACSRSRPIFVEWHKHRGMMRFYGKFFRHQYPGLLMLLVGIGVWLRFASIACIISAQSLLPKGRAG